jgi:hypothetical protein
MTQLIVTTSKSLQCAFVSTLGLLKVAYFVLELDHE